MAQRIAYLGAPVLTPDDIAAWRRNDAVLLESALLSTIVIPGVVAQCEAKTGAAIQDARYVEHWPDHYASGRPLDVGQAHTIETIELVGADGSAVQSTANKFLQREQRETFLHFPDGRPQGTLRITYLAGVNLAAYPSVRNWLLLNVSTVYAQRETLVTGTIVSELPSSFLDSMLADITVPPRF